MIRRLTFLTPALALLAPTHAQDAHSNLPAPPAAGAIGLGGTMTQTQNASERIFVEYSDIVGHPTAVVPGVPGAGFSSFDRIFGSRNGNTIFAADTDLATTEDEVIVSNGVVVAREGTPLAAAPGENVGLIDTRLSINDNGDYTFATNTDNAVTTADEVIVARVGGVDTIVARESDPIPALPGTNYGITLDSALVVGNGTVGFAASSITGATTTTNEILVFGNTVLLQRGVSAPTGQAGGASEFVDFIDLDGFHASEDGLSWIVQGDLTGATATDDVVIRNGVVVLQEGSIIPGSSFVDPIDLNGIVEMFMDPAGNWYVRGENSTQDDWVVRNGAVIATTGAPIIPGSTELWDDTAFAAGFFAQTGNGLGDYVIGGVTDIGTTTDGVLVLNGQRVVMREGEPIDLDGNGFFDDDLFINTFGNDDLFLADDLTLYVVVTMRNGAGATAGDAILRRDLADGVGSVYCATEANSTGAPAFIGGEGSATVALNDLTLNVCQLPVGSNGYFIVSRDQGVIVNPAGQQGSICVASPAMGRYSNSVLTAGAAGTVSLVLDLTAIPQPATGTVPAVAGETWNWQYWYRDVNPTVTSNFSTALSVTFN